MKIDEYEGIKTMTVKDLAVMLMDELYPEDGHISLEDDFRGNFRLRMSEEFLEKVRVESLKGKDMITIVDEAMVQGPPPPEVKEEVTIPVAEVVVPEVKVVEVKPKTTKEPKVTVSKEEKEKAKAEEKAAKEKAKAEEKAAKEKAKADEKAAKEQKAAEEKAAKEQKAAEEKAAKEQKPKTEEEKPKKVTPPKPKFVGNLEKLNPTQTKLWKKVAEDSKVELTADHLKSFLAEMNALDNKVYNTKKLEVHMTEFFAPKEPEVKTEDVEMTAVEYKEKEYWVNADGDVYETIKQEDGSEIDKKVGKVGMAYFSEMEMPSA